MIKTEIGSVDSAEIENICRARTESLDIHKNSALLPLQKLEK